MVLSQPNEPFEEAVLARAYRSLLANEGFDDLLRDLVETARSNTNCEEVVIRAIDRSGTDDATGGLVPSGSSDDTSNDPNRRSSLPMPIVSDGLATYVMTFYKSDERGRFTPTEVAHARRCSDLAGLVLSGAALAVASRGPTGIDDETGVLVRQGFEDDVAAALAANDGRVGLFIMRITDLEQINGRWGREVGDEVLRLVARAMRDAIGPAGTVGRLRRHEFGGLLPGADLAHVAEFAAATHRSLTNPLPILGRADVYATIVAGTAAAERGKANSVVPLFHATYKALEAAAGRLRDPRQSAFGL
jgi:diguanylate cyclase (GGDEF)-like protein